MPVMLLSEVIDLQAFVQLEVVKNGDHHVRQTLFASCLAAHPKAVDERHKLTLIVYP